MQRNRRLAHSLEEEVFKSQAEDEVDVGGGPGADTEAEDKEAQDRECLSLTNGSASLLPITASVSLLSKQTERRRTRQRAMPTKEEGLRPVVLPLDLLLYL